MVRLLCPAWLLGLTICPLPTVAAETIRIRIEDLAYTPQHVAAHVGDAVEWTSRDYVAHTATARNREWDVVIPSGGIGRVMLTHAGKVEYYCQYHPNMQGSISVATPP